MQRCEEHALCEKKPLSKSSVEFFVRVLRDVGHNLRLASPVFFGHIGLAAQLGSDESVREFSKVLLEWASLGGIHCTVKAGEC